MKRIALLILVGLVPIQTMAAEATIEVCVSVTDITDPGPGAISGFSDQCVTINKSVELDDDTPGLQETKTLRESESYWFPYGGCNTSGESRDYDFELTWSYTIETNAAYSERASAWVQLPSSPRIYQASEGESFSEQFSGSISDGVCADFRFQFTVGVDMATGIDPTFMSNVAGLNGLFFDPNNPGHGFDFNVIQEGGGGLVIYYYGHTTDGERLWLISEFFTGFLFSGGYIELEMFEVTGGTFGAPMLPETSWGTLEINMDGNCEDGSARLSGVDGELTMSLTRLGGIFGIGCQ